MSGSVSYVLYAIDKPPTHAERALVASLSRRAHPSARRADFWYDFLPLALEWQYRLGICTRVKSRSADTQPGCTAMLSIPVFRNHPLKNGPLPHSFRMARPSEKDRQV